MNNKNKNDIIIIKKYSNRRLYNTDTSSYITLEDLFDMVKRGVEFEVIDAGTNEDLTKNVLTQIIFEQEAKGYNMLPVSFLRQLISFYGDSVSAILPKYLDTSMKAFTDNCDKFYKAKQDLNQFVPLKIFEEMTKQNLSLFENAMKMFYNKNTNS